MARNPLRDKIAVVGIGSTRYGRDLRRTALSLGLEAALAAMPGIGSPDYSDEGMLQYLRTERVIPPYQTRGYKLVELVRVYEVGTPRRE